MLDAAVKALSQILSPPMRSILWRSIGLALVLITVLAIGLQRALSWFADYGEGWAEAMLGPALAVIGKPAQQPLQSDGQHRDQHQRQPDRAPQDGALSLIHI